MKHIILICNCSCNQTGKNVTYPELLILWEIPVVSELLILFCFSGHALKVKYKYQNLCYRSVRSVNRSMKTGDAAKLI